MAEDSSCKNINFSISDRIQTLQLSSGPCAWYIEDYTVPLIAIALSFEGGLAQDRAGREGTAALMAGLLDEGAGSYTAQEFQEILDEYAINFSATASKDHVTVKVKTLAQNSDKAFELLALALQKPLFEAQAQERVRAQMMAALRREATDPDSVADQAWRDAAFPDHPYRYSAYGSLKTLPNIGVEDIRHSHQSTLCKDGAYISVVGAISQDKLVRGMEQIFASLPAKGDRRDVSPIKALRNTETRQVLPISQATIRFGLIGIARHELDYMPALVINHILGGGVFTARLFREIREKRGLAYSAYSSLADYAQAALLIGGTTTRPENIPEVLSILRHEMEDLADNGPLASELKAAKNFLIGSYALRFDSSSKIAHLLLDAQQAHLPVQYFDQRNQMIAAVSSASASQVARRLFSEKEIIISIVGP